MTAPTDVPVESLSFEAARDELVLSECRRRGLPVAVAMAGGYARQIDDTVSIHAVTIETAARLFRARQFASL